MAEKKKKGAEYRNAQVNVVESTKTTSKDIFTIVEHNGEFLVALGNNIVSKLKFESLQEAEQYVDSKPWELILNATAAMMAIINQQSNK